MGDHSSFLPHFPVFFLCAQGLGQASTELGRRQRADFEEHYYKTFVWIECGNRVKKLSVHKALCRRCVGELCRRVPASKESASAKVWTGW